MNFDKEFKKAVNKMVSLNGLPQDHLLELPHQLLRFTGCVNAREYLLHEDFCGACIMGLVTKLESIPNALSSQSNIAFSKVLNSIPKVDTESRDVVAIVADALVNLLQGRAVVLLTQLRSNLRDMGSDVNMSINVALICITTSDLIRRAIDIVERSNEELFDEECRSFYSIACAELSSLSFTAPVAEVPPPQQREVKTDEKGDSHDMVSKIEAAVKTALNNAAEESAKVKAKEKKQKQEWTTRHNEKISVLATDYPTDEALNAKVKKHMADTMKLTPDQIATISASWTNMTCDCCRRKGHQRDYCPLKRCGKCNLEGHSVKVCPVINNK